MTVTNVTKLDIKIMNVIINKIDILPRPNQLKYKNDFKFQWNKVIELPQYGLGLVAIISEYVDVRANQN